MSLYFLIQSQEPFTNAAASVGFELAADLARSGNDVIVYLVENGVFPARSGAAQALRPLAEAGVTVLADDFSLRERGIEASRIAAGVSAAPISRVIDAMAEGARMIWN